MYYSITFKDSNGQSVNTWSDWHLIPTSRPTIAIPQPKTNIVKIPGDPVNPEDPNRNYKNAVIDLSEYLKGTIMYGPRTGSFEFYVDHNQYSVNESWISVRQKICSFLHGKRIKMGLEDEPGYFYEGRFQFNGWKSEANWSKVVIDYQLDPFKYPIKSNGDWEVDNTSIGGFL